MCIRDRLIQTVFILDAIDSFRNVVLQKSDGTAKLSNTVEVPDQRLIWIDNLLIFVLERVRISCLKDDSVHTK